MTRTPTCVWRISPALILAIDERLGEPVDSYVNGSQTWFREEGPDDVAIEWRLHPVARFRRPDGIGVYDLLPAVVGAIERGVPPPASVEELWDGLEAFPAYGDDIEPAFLVAVTTETLGVAPDAHGLVDHQRIADDWEQTSGAISIVDALLGQLTPR